MCEGLTNASLVVGNTAWRGIRIAGVCIQPCPELSHGTEHTHTWFQKDLDALLDLLRRASEQRHTTIIRDMVLRSASRYIRFQSTIVRTAANVAQLELRTPG